MRGAANPGSRENQGTQGPVSRLAAIARISPQKGFPLPGKQETVDPTLR